MKRWDIIVVGGGLSGGLLALRLRQLRPELEILVLESGQKAGGNHTWSFHDLDLTPAQLQWVESLVSAKWAGYTVRFPSFPREFDSGYNSVRSERLHELLQDTLGSGLRCGVRAETVLIDSVVLDSGETLQAGCVIDARGPQAWTAGSCGFQKFVGLDVKTKAPHGVTRPLLMDAVCDQKEGFRFVYVLPWSTRELLIEDTRYSQSPAIDHSEMRDSILKYARTQNWDIESIAREESAALPIPLTYPFLAETASPSDVPAIGIRGQFFQMTTGYSFACAVRVADRLALLPVLKPEEVCSELASMRSERRIRDAFYRGLNRMLFRAAEPKQRFKVLEKFYRLPEPVIQRFYSGSSTPADAFRILSGRPPVPVARALRSLFANNEVSLGL